MARLGQIIKTLNIGISTATDFLNKKGEPIEQNAHVKLTETQENLLLKEFSSDKTLKEKSDKLIQERLEKESFVAAESEKPIGKTTEDTTPEEIPDTKPKVEKPEEQKNSEKTDGKNKEIEKKEKKQPPLSNKKSDKTKEPNILDKTPSEEPKIKKIVEEKQPKKEAEKDVNNDVVIEIQTIAEEKSKGKIDKAIDEKPIVVKKEEKEVTKQEQTKETIKTDTSTEKQNSSKSKENVAIRNEKQDIFKYNEKKIEIPKVVGTIDLSLIGKDSRPQPKTKEEKRKEFKELSKKRFEEEKRLKLERQKALSKEDNKQNNNGRQPNNADNKPSKESYTNGRKEEFIQTKIPTLQGPKVVDKVNLNTEKPIKDGSETDKTKNVKSDRAVDKNKKDKKKRDRIKTERVDILENKNRLDKSLKKEYKGGRIVVDEEDVNQNIKDTLAIAREGRKFNKKAVDYRKEKRENVRQEIERQAEIQMAQSKILKITEFVTANELASMMKVPVNEVIKVYMNIGMFVAINQRLDAESINIVANEFGFTVDFVSVDTAKAIDDEEIDNPEDLVPRPPIVTVMGHVDHGKTSLLDYIRNANVIAGEAGGITQHIGAYNVKLDSGREITFIDTPGHEAFTAMRARGARVTDIVIIIVAADDSVMPQTVEAINHAASAGVPIVFAINKIDKDGADPEKIKAELANMNYMVESWGGKYQSQDISAKKGIGVKELLEKVLLESEILDLKANPNRKAVGSVIDVRKDKGKGNVVSILVENGTLKQGDIVLAGYAYGRIRAMYNERDVKIGEAKPSEPVLILGMKGDLQAGDKFNVMESEQAAREIISQRDQLKREQKLRTSHHLTLDEIGRRIALGNFQELNLIVKGDVDGSIEALSDSLIKLSTPEIQVKVIHKGVGQITEGDVNLAISSNAIIVGFQVRPTNSAKHLAETEEVDIRLYSIIYQAIDEVKAAMEGMLIPEKGEKIVATIEVRETFHISKIGTIAGCKVKDGIIKRSNKIRVIHDGIVIHTGDIATLKHEKDDVKEVKQGYECGINLYNFNNVSVGDIIEAFEEIEIKKTLG